MKLGICINPIPGPDGAEKQFPDFKALGYDYLELPLAQMMELDDEAFAKLTERVKGFGLPAEACNNFFPPSVRLTGETASVEKAVEYAKRAVSRAESLGIQVIVLGSSGAKNIPEGFPREKARAQFIELLVALQPIVAAAGITVALEPLNTEESNFVNSGDEGLAVMNEAGQDNVKLLLDYFHMRCENESLDVIARAGRDLRHIHIAKKEGRVYPKENDGEDYAAFFSALKAIGYSARVSVEAATEDMATDARDAARLLKPLMN
jgi:sugar phosphate isomerase/epimerase